MIDYEFIRTAKLDGTRRTVRAIEVFDCVTGETIAICRQRPFETRQAWIDRAMDPDRLALFTRAA